MKIKESNFVEELSHRNERALEYVMVHYGVWEHIDSYDSTRNPFANWIGGIARLKALDYKRKYANHLLETSWENAQYTKGLDDAIELHTQFEEEFSEETKQMLSCLKPQDRELFIKLYVEEKPFDEISKEMNTNKPVLYNRLFRSKKKLRSLFPQTNSTPLTVRVNKDPRLSHFTMSSCFNSH